MYIYFPTNVTFQPMVGQKYTVDFSLVIMNILSAAIYYHVYHGNLWQLTFHIYYTIGITMIDSVLFPFICTIIMIDSGQIVIQYDLWAADMEQ